MSRPKIQIRAAALGLCSGSRRALALVRQHYQTGKPLAVYHDLLHNPLILAELEQHGVKCVNDLADLADDAVVVISAHGVPPQIEQFLQASHKIVDATCPLVKKLHRIAADNANDELVLIANANHPETLGILGRAPQAHLLDTVAQVALLPDFDRPFTVIAQTTFEVDLLTEIRQVLQKRYGALLRDLSQVCPATAERQKAIKILAQKCDLILIAGGSNSANSRRLVECANHAGCPAVLITKVGQITPALLAKVDTVGVGAGASVPDEAIAAMSDQLAALGYNPA